MAIKHLADGQDFGAEHFPKEFGFAGSATPDRHGKAAPRFAADEDTRGPKHVAESVEEGEGGEDYAHGGHAKHHMAKGGHEMHAHHKHPHGHHVVHVEHHAQGGMIHHHAHGGYTHHHPDGSVSHHMAHGGCIAHHAHGGHMAHGGEEHHDGTYVGKMAHGGHHMAHGGKHPDEAEDRALFGKMIAEHEGKPHHENHLARGGMPRLPRGMKPKMEQHHSPINTPPRNPNTNTTPRNAMPGGEMGYGVQPSSEPMDAGADQGIPQMAHGGHRRHHRG